MRTVGDVAMHGHVVPRNQFQDFRERSDHHVDVTGGVVAPFRTDFSHQRPQGSGNVRHIEIRGVVAALCSRAMASDMCLLVSSNRIGKKYETINI